MWSRRIALACAASMAVSIAAFAQTPPETSGQQQLASPSNVQSSTQANDATSTMTLVGCLINESDYRRAHELGKGGIGGLRPGHDFVLVDAGPASTPSATSAGGTCS